MLSAWRYRCSSSSNVVFSAQPTPALSDQKRRQSSTSIGDRRRIQLSRIPHERNTPSVTLSTFPTPSSSHTPFPDFPTPTLTKSLTPRLLPRNFLLAHRNRESSTRSHPSTSPSAQSPPPLHPQAPPPPTSPSPRSSPPPAQARETSRTLAICHHCPLV
jgi:hypothetical protein